MAVYKKFARFPSERHRLGGSLIKLGTVVGPGLHKVTGQESALDDLVGVFLLRDLACVVTLIVMAAIGRKETASSSGYTSTFGAPV